MAWSGYLALGTVSGTTFTELATTGYARQPFSFQSPAGRRMQGYGNTITFPVTQSSTFSHGAFFTGSSGGTLILVYPFNRSQSSNRPFDFNPYAIAIDIVDGSTSHSSYVDLSNINMLTGTGSNPVRAGPGGNVFYMDWIPTSTSYASDVAAAAGGVLIGQVYRNGSAICVRIS